MGELGMVFLILSVFTSNNKYFHKNFRSSYGFCIISNSNRVIMRDLKNCLEKLSYKPTPYHRYVEDIFSIIPPDSINEMLMHSTAAINLYNCILI